jgi:pyridoxamine 5'-phosphate oxidase
MGDLIIPPPGEPLDIKDWRRTYKNKEEPQLEKHCLHEDPFIQFDLWFKDVAKKDLSFEEINAVSLSTCSNNKPSSRMVLLKKYDPNGFAFYTNYTSRKGRELSENPNAAMLFYWPAVSRQVRIEGIVQKLSQEDADEYWVSRPLGSRIGSKSSHQSTEIPHRSFLEDETRRLEELAKKEGPDAITRPEWVVSFYDQNILNFGKDNQVAFMIVLFMSKPLKLLYGKRNVYHHKEKLINSYTFLCCLINLF